MTTSFIAFSLFNFLIIYGSLFYVMSMKITLQRVIWCLFVNSFVTILAIYFQHALWIPMVASILFSMGLFYIFTRTKLVFLHLFVIYIICILAESTTLFFVNKLSLPPIIHGILIVVLIAFVMVFYKKYLFQYKAQLSLSSQSQLLLLLITSITFFVFYTLIFIPMEQGDIQISSVNLVALFVYFFIMVGLTTILLRTISKENQLNQQMIEQQQFKQYMQALEQVNREMQTFRHDYANILLTLRGYIEQEDLAGLQKYFNEQISREEQRSLFKNKMFSQLENLKMIELKGLIATKLLIADESHIPMTIEIPDTIQDIAMNRIHLSRIIGILLDNAIEASTSLKNPKIHLAFITMPNKVVMIIENRTTLDTINSKKLFEEKTSTKGENRGFGLFNVRKILSNYANVTLNTRIENHMFIHEMTIDGRNFGEGSTL